LQAFLFPSTHCHQLSCDADGGAEEQGTDDDTRAPQRCLNALPPHPLLSDLQALLFSSTQWRRKMSSDGEEQETDDVLYLRRDDERDEEAPADGPFTCFSFPFPHLL